MAQQQLSDVAKLTGRKELHWIAGKKQELEVYRISLQHLYFNIANGRYADRMLRLKQENPGVDIDPRKDRWANEIETMLAGEHRDTAQDKSAFDRLIADLDDREQLEPGVVTFDGGVVDGNRRLAALRKLNRENPRTGRFSFFEGVILPKETSHEDLWRIEAGLQLGLDQREDYSPVNELLKIREGLLLYERMIALKKHTGKTAIQLVAASLYGRSEAQIKESAERLRLMDDYLAFIGKKGEYDLVGRTSERFLEANEVLLAARNHQYDGKKVAKLQAVLFYVIHLGKMDSYQVRKLYDAMGGDPKRKGRKPQKNEKALDDFIGGFPDVRVLQARINPALATANVHKPAQKIEKDGAPTKHTANPKAPKQSPTVTAANTEVDSQADVAIERFNVTMEASKETKSPRQLVEAALAPLKALQEALGSKNVKAKLEEDDKERLAVGKSLEQIGTLQQQCLNVLWAKRGTLGPRSKR